MKIFFMEERLVFAIPSLFLLDKLFYYFFFMLCYFNIYYAHRLFSYLYPNGNYYRVIFLSLNVHYVFCSFLFSFVSYNKTNAIF